jgi:hypothetical protein
MGAEAVRNPVYEATLKLISASSALNCCPDLMKKPEGPYLSERDNNAKYAKRQISEAIQLLNKSEKLLPAVAEVLACDELYSLTKVGTDANWVLHHLLKAAQDSGMFSQN